MLDPAFCPETPAAAWTALTTLATRVVARPGWIVLLLISLFWMVHSRPHQRSKRPLQALIIGMLLAYCSAFFTPTFNLVEDALVQVLPSDAGDAVDAIVVLGRGKLFSPSRVEIAANLWQIDRAPVIFASGFKDAPILLKLLRKKGIPVTALDGEGCSRTTYENAQFTAAHLRPKGIHRILLVTDAPHMLRSLLTFQSIGFQVVPSPSPVPQDLDRSKKASVLLREYAGLVSYGLKGRFFQSSSPLFNTQARS